MRLEGYIEKAEDYSLQKQYWRHEDKRKRNNQKTKMGRKQLYGHLKRLTSDISHEKTSGDRDETITNIISECSKLAQEEYKTRPYQLGMVIQWELCKKLKFDKTNKWYIHNQAYVPEKEMHTLFMTQTDPLISARRPDFVIIHYNNKKELEELWILLSRLTKE